ncbi:MAG: molybdopterin-synthase adenylyltransferase [Clostridiales bacterium]|nr:molybdopterin-synthase adenylyltransferase [Clostridiales bacterium]MDK2933735.1 molybdopterin-synthase adenylyltransferase [Clostridiales bacterium]
MNDEQWEGDKMLDRDQQLRYSRQIILKEVGYKGQEKLLNSKVLVIGAGGLGSPVLYYLAAAGVGTLGIVDFDVVGISNLQRQILHFSDDLGRKKVDSAEEKIKKLNPDVKVIKYPFRMNMDNIEELIQDYDVVVDAVDNFTARYLISDCCYFMKKPLIEGAVLGFDGILMTIIPDRSPCYRCLYPMPPQDGVVPTCNDTGILGMITGTIGSLQALETVKVLLGIGETLSGRILTFDGLNLSVREVPWKKRQACPLCGENPTIKELVEYEIKCKSKIPE